ncbi:MAG TPA: metallophosphoesterase [Actinomycetota bacterium]
MMLGSDARTRRRPARLAMAALVPAALVASLWTSPQPSSADARIGASVGSRAGAEADSVRIAAAGDIACQADPYGSSSPDNCQYDETSDLLVGKGFARVLALGDNQYDVGAYSAYISFYDPWWGRVKRRTSPVPGNHEYDQDPSATPTGYFRYFGDRVKGPDGLGYYSFDVPHDCTPGTGVCWHLIALSSELCLGVGGCGPAADPADPAPGNRMYEWLKQDLAAHPQSTYPCTLAFWHHPLFSFSTASAGSAAIRPLWRALYRADADVVLNGHSHNYQRWRPMTPGGRRDPGGIREFVVGTGGASRYALRSSVPANVVTAQDRSFGILVLSLDADGYSWAWRTAAGQHRYRDAQTTAVACH